MCVCVRACVRACRHNTTVFHLQCSLFELMLNVLVHSYGHVRTLPPFYGTCVQSSHRCVWCGFEPRSGHVRQTKFCLRVCQVVLFFSGFSHFRPTYSLARLCSVTLSKALSVPPKVLVTEKAMVPCRHESKLYWMLSINSTNKGDPVCPSNQTDIPTP